MENMVLERNNVDGIMLEELTASLLRLSNNKIGIELAQKLAEDNLKLIDLSNPYIAHKGISWIAEQILRKY